MMPRRIAVVSSTRADYGLLRWLLEDLRTRDDVELRIVVTGAHLDPKFGETWTAITDDGFEIEERVPILEDDDSALAVARATGRATIGVAEALDRIRPDLVVVLGDRFEILGAAQAAMLLGIPIAHIAGGELTEGAFDDAMRHAITKLAQLHFTAAEPYSARVRQLGEDPERVQTVGAIGLDNLERLDMLDRGQLEAELGFDLSAPLLLVTHHPETLSGMSPEDALAPLFTALEGIDARVVFTKGNADTGGRRTNELVDEFVARHPDRMRAFTSLGQLRYLSLMTIADAVVGNSSSGVLEAPTAGTPSVNIGDRQTGRLRAPSVIDVPNEADAIAAGMRTALSDEFTALAGRRESPFGSPVASAAIAERIATADLDSLRVKRFHDVNPEAGA